MHPNNPTHDRVIPFQHHLGRALRKAAVGLLGALALGTAIQPARAQTEVPFHPYCPELPFPEIPYPEIPFPEEPINTAPKLNLPGSLVVEAQGPWGAYVYFEASASDLEDDFAPQAIATPGSGSIFSLGETTVNVSAKDSAGLSTQGSFTVLVQDTTAPHIYLGGDECSTDVTIALGTEFSDPGAWAYDTVDNGLGVAVDGTVDTHTVGSYTLTYSAKDRAGNRGTAIRTVTVVDPMPALNKRRYSGGNFSGQGDFNVTAKGHVTAALHLDGVSWRGTFPLTQRQQTVTFNGAKKTTLTAQVSVDVNGRGEPAILVSTPTHTLELEPVLYSAQNPAPASVIGTYTAVLRSYGHGPEPFAIAGATNEPSKSYGPIGSGFVTLNVARDGRVRAAGYTAEGSPITGSSYLVKAPCGYGYYPALAGAGLPTTELPSPEIGYAQPAQFHLHAGLYKTASRGSVSGQFILDRHAPWGSIGGQFRWHCPEGALPLYGNGLDVWGGIVGSRYEPAVPADTLGLRFDFEGMTPFVASGKVTTTPTFFDMSTTDEKRALGLRCRFTLDAGQFTGARYRGSAARSYKAIWLQEQDTIEGFSVSDDGKSRGAVNLEDVYVDQPTQPVPTAL